MTTRRPSGLARTTCDVVAIDEVRVQKVARRVIAGPIAHDLAATFGALSNPTRIRIVDALSHSELCVCDLAALLNMRISTVSHQLALLKRHHIVTSRRDGKMLHYSLDDRHVRTLFDQARAHLQHGDRVQAPVPTARQAVGPRRIRKLRGART